MGLVDTLGAEDRVQVKFSDFYKLMKQAAQYEIAMNAVVYLKKQNLIETVQPSNDVAFGLYQGKRVIVDDGCPVADGVYTTYLFGNGAVALGNGNPAGFVPTETDRAKRKGSGVDYLINRKTMILHPRGIAWQNAEVAKIEGPSRTEVAIPKNWKPVYEPKQIRIVAFKHKLE